MPYSHASALRAPLRMALILIHLLTRRDRLRWRWRWRRLTPEPMRTRPIRRTPATGPPDQGVDLGPPPKTRSVPCETLLLPRRYRPPASSTPSASWSDDLPERHRYLHRQPLHSRPTSTSTATPTRRAKIATRGDPADQPRRARGLRRPPTRIATARSTMATRAPSAPSDDTGDVCQSNICCPERGSRTSTWTRSTGANARTSRRYGLGATCARGDRRGRGIGRRNMRSEPHRSPATRSPRAVRSGTASARRTRATRTCDNFYTRVRFLENPGGRYEFTPFRGCGTAECNADVGYTKTSPGASTIAPAAAGECPCDPSSCRTSRPDYCTGENYCSNDSADFMIRVRWIDTSAPTCENYVLEISNGRVQLLTSRASSRPASMPGRGEAEIFRRRPRRALRESDRIRSPRRARRAAA